MKWSSIHVFSAITIIVVTVITLGCIIKYNYSSVTKKQQQGKNTDDKDFPPKPKWKPNIPVNIERTVEAFSGYTQKKISFAVFENGTCIPIDPKSTQPQKDVMKALDLIYHRHPDFNPEEMKDGNWVVSYSNVAYTVCFSDEITSNWDYIDRNHLDGVAPYEKILVDSSVTNEDRKRVIIGLFGRARWFMDCQNPKVVRLVLLNSTKPDHSAIH